MDRRKFISDSVLLTGITIIPGNISSFSDPHPVNQSTSGSAGLYELFRNPVLNYHPFVRWWWNGDKVEKDELIRELHLLKNAGIGGVEINPVQFPSRFDGDDLGKKSLLWLSEEWIDMLKAVFDEARSLGMTCDLIIGSGWPWGGEFLEGEERSQIVVISVKKLSGPSDYEISRFEIFREADPAISSPFPGRKMELLSLSIIPDPLSDISQIKELNSYLDKETIKINIPEGKYALYALVKINGFMQVINGAPGAAGPVLNHYNKTFVREYLSRTSYAIEKRIGPLSGYIRALFTDSLELEGSNWTFDMPEEFRQRRGYDLVKFLPLILFKSGAMGNVTDLKYGVTVSGELEKMLQRIRYDFELTKAELLEDRFVKTFAEWCMTHGIRSRAQAYGRGIFPLEGSLWCDIPEAESWTTNFLKHKIGEEMPEDDYRRGRAYTMINKYVSSAANLKGKRLVSCEEMTDTYKVFNTSLEDLKIGGDQSTIAGTTHSVFHGFNYSPPEAPWPGWIRYGAYYNESNPWWSYFHFYNIYKARLSSILQNASMFSDIAILPPTDDMWGKLGARMEPFPSTPYADYVNLIWEAVNKNGSGCDYVSQRIIRDSEIRKGIMSYGPKKYTTIFIVMVESLDVSAAEKLFEFVSSGGKLFCIETIPSKSLGWKDSETRDKVVAGLVEKMKVMSDRFIFLEKPEKDFISWYKSIQEKYGIRPYIRFENPDPYIMQNRYQTDDGSELLFITHSRINDHVELKITFSKEIAAGRQSWIWVPDNGERYKISLDKELSIALDVGPAESFMFVFDRNSRGQPWKPLPPGGQSSITISDGWSAEFRHCRDNTVKAATIDTLVDLKEMPDFVNFAGTVIYRNYINIREIKPQFINLGKVFGISELKINGRDCGTRWYGRRIFGIGEFIVTGDNLIEVKITTSMGNYMKSLKDNPIAQYWTNEKNKIQPLQSMGLIGPVTVY